MRSWIITMAMLVVMTTPVPGQEVDPVSRWAAAASLYGVYADIVYQRASGQDIKLDVITPGPRSQVRPTVILIHSGGWTDDTKSDYMLFTLPYLVKGMNTVNIDYRLARDSVAPAAVEDSRCALRWVYRHAKDFGFDTNRIVVFGSSSGAHLALMTGMLDSSAGFDNECPAREGEPPLKVAAIVNMVGPTDVADLIEGPHRQDFAVRWFGDLPNRAELARRLSPLTYVRPGLPPIITIHGDADDMVPYEHAVRLHQALDRAGVANQLVTAHGWTHHRASWKPEDVVRVQEQVFAFLEKYGVLPP